MYDVGLSFNISNLKFYRDNKTSLEGHAFCKALAEVVPDKPANKDSSASFKDKAQWFKDILAKDGGEDLCKQKCFFEDYTSYSQAMKASCLFLFNQFTFLRNQSIPSNTADSEKVDESKRES